MARRRQGPDVLPIRIRRDLVVTVTGLPHDLTRTEALKIAGVVEAMGSPETAPLNRPGQLDVDEKGGWRGPSLADVVCGEPEDWHRAGE